MASETTNGDRMLTPAELKRIRELITEDMDLGLTLMNWVSYTETLEKEQQVSEGETPKSFSYHIVQRHCEEIERAIKNEDIPPGILGTGDLSCPLEVSISTPDDETRLPAFNEGALLGTTPLPAPDSNVSSSTDTRMGGVIKTIIMPNEESKPPKGKKGAAVPLQKDIHYVDEDDKSLSSSSEEALLQCPILNSEGSFRELKRTTMSKNHESTYIFTVVEVNGIPTPTPHGKPANTASKPLKRKEVVVIPPLNQNSFDDSFFGKLQGTPNKDDLKASKAVRKPHGARFSTTMKEGVLVPGSELARVQRKLCRMEATIQNMNDKMTTMLGLMQQFLTRNRSCIPPLTPNRSPLICVH